MSRRITRLCQSPIQRKNLVLGTALSSASLLALSVMLMPQPAHAASECGAEGGGADTITCTGASYPNGITYAGSDGLNLLLNNSAMTVNRGTSTDGVVLSGTTANDLTITAASLTSIDGGSGGSAITVNNAGDGKAAVVLNGGTYTTNYFQQGTIQAIHNSGAGDSIITMNNGQVSNTNPSVNYGLYALVAGSGTGNATIRMTGGSLQSAYGLRAAITNAASAATAGITMDAGTISGVGVGAYATTSGPGLAQVTINGGSYSGSNYGAMADSTAGAGNAQISITGGTITSTGLTLALPGLQAFSNSGSATASISGGSITIKAPHAFALIAKSQTGSATASMTGGTILTTGGGVLAGIGGGGVGAIIQNAASTADAQVTFSGGSITTTGTANTPVGLGAQTAGSGAARIQLSAGASGTGGSITSNTVGAWAQAVAGQAAITMDAGSVTGNTQLGALYALHSSGSGDSIITLNGGTVSNSGISNSHVLDAEVSGTATGNATVVMTGGSVQTSTSSGSSGLSAAISNAASSGTASVAMTGGSMTGGGIGAYATTNGSGLAQVTINGGSISSTVSLGSHGAQANNTGSGNAVASLISGSIVSGTSLQSSGLFANANSGSAQASMTGGTITSKASQGAGIFARSATGPATASMSDGSVTQTSANPAYGLYAQVSGASTAAATVQLSGGTVSTSGANGYGLYAQATSGQAVVQMTNGSVTTGGNNAFGVYATSTAGPATITMNGGSVTTSGTLSAGLRSLSANGLASVQMTGGTVTANGNAQGVLATNLGGAGTYNISITGGTVTGGGPGAVQGYSTTGGAITIGAGAVINANTGTSGIAISNTGTNAAATSVTTAGTITGQINFQAGTASTLNITGGSIAGDIIGGGNTALSFDLGAGNSFIYGAAYTISGLSGTAINSGTVIMDGTLTSPNVTIASGAVLQLGNNDANGGLSPDVTDNGSFVFNRTDTVSFGNAISGTGTVVQAGSGTTILTGANLYSGGTIINAGILQAAADANLGDAAGGLTFNGGTFENTATFISARTVTLTGNGTLQTDADLTLSGAISGAGALAKTGSGTLILTGAGSYSGGTTISAGTLQIGNGGTSGSIIGNVTDNAALVFNRSDALGLSGVISGSGTVSQIGGGTTTLSGVNSYSGGTTISSGTLQGSATSFGSGAITDNAALVISQPADAAFANAINGTGSFTKTGAGRLSYTGTGGLSGPTTVAAGLLSVNGSLASSAVTVQTGASLGGNGTVGAATIQSGGTIAPGNSIGTLHINGAFVQSAGSTYNVEVDPNSNASDLIMVSGTATLQSGAGLNVLQNPAGNYQLGTVYKVLTASGGLSGTYTLSGQTSGVSAFLGLKDSYDANNAYLTVIQTQSLTSVATTPNQQAVANAVQNLPLATNPATGTSTAGPVATAVLNLPDASSARAAFDQLSGQVQASAQGALLANGLYVRDVAFDRLRDVICTQTDPKSQKTGCNSGKLSIWEQGFGGWGGIAGNGNASGLNHSAAGFLVGADIPAADWRLGFFGGYSHSDFNVVSGGALGDSNDYHLGGYAGTLLNDNVALRLGASYTWSGITTDRAVAIGSFTDALHGIYNAGTTQVFGELGYGLAMEKLSLEPFANLTYVGLTTSGFTEAGGPAALTVRANTTENMVATLGLRPSMDIGLAGFDGSLRGMLGWRHTFGTVVPDAQVSFAGGNVFGVSGVPIARDAAALETGLDVTLEEGMTFGLTYGGQFSGRSTDQSARGTIRISF